MDNQNNEVKNEEKIETTSPENQQSIEEKKIEAEKESTKEESNIDTSLKNDTIPQPKKKITEDFNSDEQIVYELQEEKDANPIGVILFMVLLISFVFFLPQITKKFKEFTGTQTNTAPMDNPNEVLAKGDLEKNPEIDTKKYIMFEGEFTETNIGDVKFKNFLKAQNGTQYTLTFTIINDGDLIYDYSAKNVIEFYDDESKIGESRIYSKDPLAAKASTELTINISEEVYKKSIKFRIEEKKEKDYPEVELTNNEGEYQLLKCNIGKNNLTYYFKDNLLEKIDDVYKEEINISNYQESLQLNKNKIDEFNKIEGITATIIEIPESGFTTKNTFELANIKGSDLTNLKEYKYYAYHTQAKTVKYENESLGYTCS